MTSSNLWRAVGSMLLVAVLAGCASITGSKTQPISITAVCEAAMIQGATCTATNDKGVTYVQTPGTAMIQKSVADLSVSCTKGSSISQPVIVSSSSNVGVWGNILLGGPIGAAIDAGTGAGFDYPPNINVVFNAPCAELSGTKTSSPLAPVSTIEATSSSQLANKIRELQKLFEEKLINESEYEKMRKSLLDAM